MVFENDKPFSVPAFIVYQEFFDAKRVPNCQALCELIAKAFSEEITRNDTWNKPFRPKELWKNWYPILVRGRSGYRADCKHLFEKH
jgi:hypothetical protein